MIRPILCSIILWLFSHHHTLVWAGDPGDFWRMNDSIPQLSEIIIMGKKRPIVLKKDTTVFRADAYRNGTEKSLETLLEKIPGMKVDPFSGKLSYHGSTIQAVKLDGADLTGADYVNLTRQIAADLVDEIEVIENDPDNPLLKDIRPSGKQVLNLKLKKDKARYNGDADVGTGFFSHEKKVADIKVNLLRLAKKIKSFAAGGFNNVGRNESAYNYFEYQDAEKKHGEAYPIAPLLNSSLQTSWLPAQRYFMNQNILSDGNFLIQPKDARNSIRINLYGMKDVVQTQHLQAGQYRSDLKIPATSDDLHIRARPFFVKSAMEWRQFISPVFFMKYMFTDERHQVSDQIQHIMNHQQDWKGNASQKRVNHSHHWELTYRLSRTLVFRTALNLGRYRLHEQVRWESPLPPDSTGIVQAQQIRQHRNIIEWRAYLTAVRGKNDYEMEAGVTNLSSTFYAAAFSQAYYPVNQHQQYYTQAYHAATATFRRGEWVFKPKIKVSVNQFRAEGEKPENWNREKPGFEPEISVAKKISDQLKWQHIMGARCRLLSDRPFFREPVFVSVRQGYINAVKPDLQNIIQMQTMLVYQDLFRQSEGLLQLSYIRSDQWLIPGLQMDQSRTLTSFIASDRPVTLYTIRFSGSQFLSRLRTTIAVETQHGFSNDFNFINGDILRNNRYYNREWGGRLSVSAHKNIKIMYELKLISTRVKSSISADQTNGQLRDNLRLIWQPSKAGYIMVTAERYRPQLSSSYSLLLLDMQLQYRPPGKRYGLSLTGKNILDQRFFRQTQISDYSRSDMQIALLPGYWMAAWSYRF